MTILDETPSASPPTKMEASPKSNTGAVNTMPSPKASSPPKTSGSGSGVTPGAAIVTPQQSQAAALALSNMISSVADRYITPEYLAPLPSSSVSKQVVCKQNIFIFGLVSQIF